MQAIWFIVYMVVLQQIEGNLIFPRVVGSRIGLPPIIMISAIILFSAFFGIIGLLVSGPVTFVIYTFIRRFVYHRIEAKKIPHYKYDPCYDSPERDMELERELEGYPPKTPDDEAPADDDTDQSPADKKSADKPAPEAKPAGGQSNKKRR